MGNSEEYIQYECVQWFWNTYPNLRGLLCCNKNNSRNKIEGNKWRALGVIAGRADLVLYYDGKTYHIEMKTEKGIQSKEQKDWASLVESSGFRYYICRSLFEFQTLIKLIIK